MFYEGELTNADMDNSVKTVMKMTRKSKKTPRPHTSVLLTRVNIISLHLLENCGEWDPSDAFVKPGDQLGYLEQ